MRRGRKRSLTLETRNREIYEYWRSHQEYESYRQIGQRYHLSGQMIFIIVDAIRRRELVSALEWD